MCHYSVMEKKRIDISLLITYFRCETTRSEEIAIFNWLAEDPDGSHKKEYNQARALYEGLVMYSDDVKAESRSLPVWKKFLNYSVRAAAVVAVIVSVGILSRHAVLDKLSRQMETIVVPEGKSMQMALADGTKVWLNSGTKMDIPVVFSNKSRKVKLYSGEVLFEVEKNAKWPFIVDTYAGDITVLGTKFDVIVEKDREFFSTALLEGCVKVDTKIGAQREFILHPNESLTRDDNVWTNGFIKSSESVICWTKGLIDVADMSFEDILRKMENAFNVKMVIEREDMPVIGLTRGKIRVSDGIDGALHVLEMASDFEYEIDDTNNLVYIR